MDASEKSSFKAMSLPPSNYNYLDSLNNYQSFCDTPKCPSVFNTHTSIQADEHITFPSFLEQETPFTDDSSIFRTAHELAGEWNIHRFEEELWCDNDKPYAKLDKSERIPRRESSNVSVEQAEEEEEPEEDELDVLTEEIIASSLSYLDRAPITLEYALCKCMLPNKNLSDITALKYCHYIQYLDISKNQLTTLAALGQLPFLQYLDASSNYLTEVLNFQAPLFLTMVNLSHNYIKAIPDLTDFWSITDLNLSHNNIERISGLGNLRFLSYLDLSFNKIVALENLNNTRIQFLILNHNNIDSDVVEEDPIEFRTLDYIRFVDLANNNINSLQMFQNADNIECIDICNNHISNLLEIYYLRNCRYLSKLNLRTNPVESEDYYLSVCLENVKNLIILDGKEINAEHRVMAKSDANPLQPGKVTHIELVLLQQINNPDIEPHMLPINSPPPIVVILVGPAGSKKKNFVKKLCKSGRVTVAGISHTTRPRIVGEVDGEDYHYISDEGFEKLARCGKFISVSKFKGHSFGIVEDEIYKDPEKIKVFHSDLSAAVSLKMKGVITKFVLAMPKDENTHLNWLKEKYSYDEINRDIIRVKNSCYSPLDLSIPRISNLVKKKISLDEDPVTITITVDDLEVDIGSCCQSIDTSNYSDMIPGETSLKENESNVKPSKQTHRESSGSGSSGRDSKKVSFNESVPNKRNTKTNATGALKINTERGSNRAKITSTPREDKTTPSPVKIEKLELFFKEIIQSRMELLETHWLHPGVFSAVVFTDQSRQCLKRLRCILKSVVEFSSSLEPRPIEKDGTMERLVKTRLSNLDFQGFAKIAETPPPHCDCDVKYVESHF